METARLDTASASSGSTDTVQIDAEEDRRIHGVVLSFEGFGLANSYNASAEVWIGSKPSVGGDTALDLGGKLYLSGHLLIDSTNQYALLDDAEIPLEADESWDWNEDVTLTVEVDNGGGSTDAISAVATVFYTEA